MNDDERKTGKPVHMPAGMHYDCVMCGRGCVDFWDIPVDERSEELLLGLDLEAAKVRGGEQPPFRESEYDKGMTVLQRSEDVCVFLCDDMKCNLHKIYGARNKPQSCIDFPFVYVDTPAGAYVGVSFACTAVLDDHGRPAEAHRGDVIRNLEVSDYVRQSGERPRLNGRVSIDFDAYLELEGALSEIGGMDRTPLRYRLLAQSMFLDVVSRTFAAARLDEGADLDDEEFEAVSGLSDRQIVAALAARYRADRWGRLLALAAKPRPAYALHRAFIGLVTSFRQAVWRKSTRARAVAYLLRQYALHATRIGGIRLEPLAGKFDYDAFERVAIDDSVEGEFDRLLTRYFQHALFRKDLLLAETVHGGHRFLLMRYALATWYTVGFAEQEGHADATVTDVREALRNVEKVYGRHSRFQQFLERQPVLATIVESILYSQRYPASMVHPPAPRA